MELFVRTIQSPMCAVWLVLAWLLLISSVQVTVPETFCELTVPPYAAELRPPPGEMYCRAVSMSAGAWIWKPWWVALTGVTLTSEDNVFPFSFV